MVLERARLRVLNAQVYSSVVDQTHLELASFSLTRTVSFKRNHRPLTFAKGRRHDQSRMHMELGTFSSTRNHRPLTLTKGRRHDQSSSHEQRPPRALPPLLLYKSEEGGCDVRLLMLRDHAVQAHS